MASQKSCQTESAPFLGSNVCFEAEYPTIEKIEVTIKEISDPIWGKHSTRYYHKETLPGSFIYCSNRLCHTGGFDLQSLLDQMVKNNSTTLEKNVPCDAQEGTPKGRKMYKQCLHQFEIRIEIEYAKGG